MLPESFVTWKWRTPGYRTQFTAEHVNTLARMINRHFPGPVPLICVTDDTAGLDPRTVFAMPPWDDWKALQSPHGPRWPSCYRRLRAFHPEAAKWFGQRFVSLDLDMVVTGDLTPLFDRAEDFVGWQDPNKPAQLCGSMFMLTAGSRPYVWTSFDPGQSPARAASAGFMGSDQAWVSYALPGAARWTRADGIVSYRKDLCEGALPLPTDTRLVVFHGRHDPWGPQPQTLDWVREHYV